MVSHGKNNILAPGFAAFRPLRIVGLVVIVWVVSMLADVANAQSSGARIHLE